MEVKSAPRPTVAPAERPKPPEPPKAVESKPPERPPERKAAAEPPKPQPERAYVNTRGETTGTRVNTTA